MKSMVCHHYLSVAQEKMFLKFNAFSQLHPVLGRFCAVPLSVADVGLDVLKSPLNIIEKVALTAINLFGAAFSAKCSTRDTLLNLEWLLVEIASFPVAIAMAPLKLIYQIFAISINPQQVKSINFSTQFTNPFFARPFVDLKKIDDTEVNFATNDTEVNFEN